MKIINVIINVILVYIIIFGNVLIEEEFIDFDEDDFIW